MMGEDHAVLDHRMAAVLAWAKEHSWAWLRHLLIAVALSYVLALSAQLRVPVPLSPVPVTAQTLVVLLIGALLPRRYLWSTFGFYLLAGASGLPYFAGGSLAGPTGGYLLGFLVGATAIAVLMEKGWGRRPATALLALLGGNVLIYVVGLPWLALFVGPDRAIALGFLPFLVGDLVKLAAAFGVTVVRYRR